MAGQNGWLVSFRDSIARSHHGPQVGCDDVLARVARPPIVIAAIALASEPPSLGEVEELGVIPALVREGTAFWAFDNHGGILARTPEAHARHKFRSFGWVKWVGRMWES